MEYIANTTEFRLKNTAVALGKFETLHKGHQLLLNQIGEYQKKGYTGVMFTFDVPPGKVLNHKEQRVIYTREERYKKIQKIGLDILIEYPFTKEFARQLPEEFVSNILADKLGVRAIVVGEDFCFGYKRSGNVEVLRQLSAKYNYELIVVPKLQLDGRDVSSTRVRECIQQGEMEKITQMLGTPFSVSASVVHGNHLGESLLGMPTANQRPNQKKLLPPRGVYVSRIIYKGNIYYGISNIGVKPTIDAHLLPTLETFIFDFHEDLYGKEIEVQLLHYKRPEQKFASLEELAAQMKKDAQYGQEYIQNIKSNSIYRGNLKGDVFYENKGISEDKTKRNEIRQTSLARGSRKGS